MRVTAMGPPPTLPRLSPMTQPPDPIDDQLAGTASSGQLRPSAVAPGFETFYAAEYRSVVGLGYVLTGSQWVAEDLAQQAFTEAHRRWDTIGTYDDPGAWVRRVMVNRSTSRFRRLTSETKALARIGSRRAETVEPTERTTEVWAAVRRLPRRQAQTIALFYWEDLSLSQIADLLECSTETVKTHLKRARASLADTLDGLEESQ